MNIYAVHFIEKILSGFKKIGFDRNQLESLSKQDYSDIEKFLKRRIKKGLKNFSFIYPGGDEIGKVFLEFGTGKAGTDLIIAYLLGFKRIYTVDINNHLDVEYIKKVELFTEYIDSISSKFNIPKKQVSKRLDALRGISDLDRILKCMNIHFINFSKLEHDLEEIDHIDLWYSESNLQRIPIGYIQNYFRIIGEKISTQTKAFHRIDMRDIHIQKGYPFNSQNIHRLDYLKHGELMWKLLSNPNYGSQNRLRYPQFLTLFKGINLVPEREDIFVTEEDIRYVENMDLPPIFKYLSPEQTAIFTVRVLLKYS